MKKRNRINPIEAHFEKMILVGVSGVLLAVLAMQFLTQPNAVQVPGASAPVPPGDVFDRIEENAQVVIDQMRSPNPVLPEVPDQDVATRFAQVSNLGASDVRFARIGDALDLESLDIGPAGSDAATTYAMPMLPVPGDVVASTHRATIDPFFALTEEAFANVLPAEQPFDALAVSVEGVVSGAGLLASLEQDPDGDSGPVRPLPLSWWRGNLELLGVEVERQLQSETGSWGETVVLSGMPGEESLLTDARGESITPADLIALARSAQEVVRGIAQPAFPPTVAGTEWTKPSEMVNLGELSEEEAQIALVKRRYDLQLRKIERLQLALENIGGSSGSGGAANERRGEGGGSGREGGGGSNRPSIDRDQQRREVTERNIMQAEDVLADLADELADLGAPVDGEDDNRRENEPLPELPTLLDAEELPVWVHDFEAAPGATYRYRMRLVVNNPLYAKEQYLSESQQASAGSSTLEGAWSDWSSPVYVEADRHFFVISASENDVIGNGPRAAVEVYEFYYGYWRKASASIQPGDTIFAEADLPDDLVLWDEEFLRTSGPQQARGRSNPRVPSMDAGPRDERRSREFEVMDDPRDPRDASRTRRADRDDESDLPEGAEEGPESLELRLSAMLLDVMSLPGEGGGARVVFRGPDGRLVTRDTALDRTSALYRRLASNADEGVDQGQPEPEPNERGRQPLQQRNEDRLRRDEGPGGGETPGG